MFRDSILDKLSTPM